MGPSRAAGDGGRRRHGAVGCCSTPSACPAMPRHPRGHYPTDAAATRWQAGATTIGGTAMVTIHEPVRHLASAPTTVEVERRIARRTIRRLAGRSEFVGGALAFCAVEQGIDEDILADELGCSARRLVRLALSRRPTPGAPGFDAALRQLASATGADGERLTI